jgi:metal-responsive CopG/Arc/MetJ family transcriptional regulator
MARIVVDIDDDLNKEFRKVIIDRFGSKKGALKEAIEEAVKLWIQKQRGSV